MFYSKEQDGEAPRDGSAKLSEWGKETQTEIKQIHYLEKYSCIYILLISSASFPQMDRIQAIHICLLLGLALSSDGGV